MNSDWQVVREMVEQALELEGAERRQLLDERCGDDRALREEVENLIAEDAKDDVYLDRPPGAELCSGPVPEPVLGDLQPGDRVGVYEIRRPIASGGMGTVYLAERLGEGFQMAVAVKVIKRGMDSEEILRRFRNERRVLARLEYPGIARLIDGGITEDGRSYLVMEYVRGVPVDRFCDDRRLGVKERLMLFRKVCEAVHVAHRNLVVHRDLKPGNILVTADGEPKLLDFGIAKLLDPEKEASETAVTSGLSKVLTPQYASPEQVRGDPITIQTDVYSLGIVLYELLTGRRPYAVDTSSRELVERAICEQEATRPSITVEGNGTANPEELATLRQSTPSVLAGQLRGDLDNIVVRALHKDPWRRYASAEHLGEDLRRHLGGLPVMARPDTWSYRTGKFLQRNRTSVTAAAGIAVALLVGAVFSLQFAFRAQNAERQVTAAKQEAEDQLADVMRFSDAMLIRELEQRQESLWPSTPDKAVDLEEWMQDAQEVLGRRMRHEEVLHQVREDTYQSQKAGAMIPASATGPDWDQAGQELRWRYQTSEAVVQGLQGLEVRLEQVERRHQAASTLRRRSIDEFADQWEAAIDDVFMSYGELEIEPQLGLVPIGRDPTSDLWEFWHVDSGSRPERDPETDQLLLTEDSGIVFALLPGGTFWMGNQKDDKKGLNYDPFTDPDPSRDRPHHEVVEPFLMAKYELTQGQWLRLTGDNPSFFPAGKVQHDGKVMSLLHPVERVSWHDCRAVLGRWKLVLPTMAQWEYACRGGTNTVWFTGDKPHTLGGFANLTGQDSISLITVGASYEPGFVDGYNAHAPVGTFKANPFGLHDVHGNLWEWCIEPMSQEGGTAGLGARAARGGSYHGTALDTRSGHWSLQDPTFRHKAFGARAVCLLDR